MKPFSISPQSRVRLAPLGFLILASFITAVPAGAQSILDHPVKLDDRQRLQPWTSYTDVIGQSMNFIKNCPTVPTRFGADPWYLVTSKLQPDGSFMRNQNCQGSHAYWAVETCRKDYAFTGDRDGLEPAQRILERILYYHTPGDWAWPHVPRVYDDTPDGEYTDEGAQVDKICMVGVAYLRWFKLTGEPKYLDGAKRIAATVTRHVRPGDARHSPLSFEVNLKTGKVTLEYSANMTPFVMLVDELASLGIHGEGGSYAAKRAAVLKWILDYPMKNNIWSGYYEDVNPRVGFNAEKIYQNLNQQTALETARYLLRHPEADPEWKTGVPGLIHWVERRFGRTKHYGATSIREQDCCFFEMSSHTARYASVAAAWFGVCLDPAMREEARAAFALTTYSTCNKYSKDGRAINYVGIGYANPWFVDSYFDFLSHIMDGMAELPEMAPANEDHLLGSSSIVTQIRYQPRRIEYQTYDPGGQEILRLSFKPQVLTGGAPLAPSQWSYGEFRGVPGVLRITRQGVKQIVIEAAP